MNDKKERERTYLKLGHLVLNHLLGSNHRNTAVFYTRAYFIMVSFPIKALIRTFKVCLLQAIVIQ